MNRTRLAAVLIAALAVSGCAAQASQPDAGSGAVSAPSVSPAPKTAGQPSRVNPTPAARVLGHPRHHALQRPVIVEATNAKITSVVLRGGGRKVAGKLARRGARWRSTGRLAPLTTYTAAVQLATDGGGKVQQSLTVRTGPAAETLTMTATPGPRQTMGVGEPVVVTFNRPVQRRAAVQRRMSITTSRGPVVGAWHWFSPTVVHYRPRHFWPADTTVHVHVDLKGLYVGQGVWGDRNHDWSWRVGARHVTHVNARRDTFTVRVNGTKLGRWPTGTGMPGFETRDGVYTVLGKLPVVKMTSCSIGLACTPGTPGYYDLTVHWDTRLTDTGTFVHAAPWDSQLGQANTSHGCIHLSTAHAHRFYRLSRPGDVVIVTGTGRASDIPGDPGMMDWNMSWQDWLAGSANTGTAGTGSASR